MIIDTSYFKGDINIPGTDKESVQALVNWFIEKYEPEILESVLGHDMYAAFTAGLLVDPVAERWQSLLSGTEYAYGGITRRWKGVKTDSEEYPRSFIANYVYCKYMEHIQTDTTPSGEYKAKNENSVPASPSLKMMRAWNEMTEWIAELSWYTSATRLTYPEQYSLPTYWWFKTKSARRIMMRINEFGI